MQLKKTLYGIFAIVVLSIAMINQSYSMDLTVSTHEGIIIPINNGLHTRMPVIIASTKCSWISGREIVRLNLVQDDLERLIYYKSALSKKTGDVDLFCSVVFKQSDNVIINLGQFNKQKHREAIVAMEQNKALYYLKGQGAIVYSVIKQPNPNICIGLDKMIMEARKQVIELNN
jgi:hypothetical protein